MESVSTCRSGDIVCIAAELLSRWERTQEAGSPPGNRALHVDADDDCLVCLVSDWDA